MSEAIGSRFLPFEESVVLKYVGFPLLPFVVTRVTGWYTEVDSVVGAFGLLKKNMVLITEAKLACASAKTQISKAMHKV